MQRFWPTFLFYLLLFLNWLPALAQSDRQSKQRARYKYLIYVPEVYTATRKPLPLIIYLHGGSQRGDDLGKLKQYGPPHAIEQGLTIDAIVVSPQCPDGKFWSTDNWFDSLYTELKATYRIDPKRVYLTGISMGGYGTWQTAVAYPNTFAAIAPLCGGCDDSTQICRIRNVPVWAFHGTDDDLVPFEETARLIRHLTACKGKVTFTKLADKGHNIQYLYEDRSIYNWLLKQHR
ncbi:carboxylesterase family protein [Fibrella forsythiae]|uniref:Dienelactone hydrolase family protein n=1 Tax=Fibrella forsythiae TaxID=2817061 RepID=A0ABS3JDG7_9BACT|nr:PHB depolymerase family esterase [Fibrella forsythiae]MBO0948040.1 dienelactone hydrolase family protein [Fibrella forsythiae]